MSTSWWPAAVLGLTVLAAGAQPIQLTADPTQTNGLIDERVYGHFFEHIYHSANGGLWGDVVWNRSFEEAPGGGAWVREGEDLVQSSLATNVTTFFGDPAWTDYEYTVEARRDGGGEGFLIPFRRTNPGNYYWLNLGGWQNVNHGIERAAGGGRTILETTPGRIESGRWYTIRIRAEGPRIQAWLDGEPIIDLTDNAGPRAGAVGLGSWNTAVRYRNVRVTDLAGNLLTDELPMPTGSALPRYWTRYGVGQAGVAGGALNGDNSVVIVGAEGGETGLRQVAHAARRGQPLAGSLWARGDAPDGLVVRLRQGSRVIAEQRLAGPGAEWTELPIRLSPRASSRSATLEVGLVGAGQVNIDQVSLMPEAWARGGGFRPDLRDAIAGLQPTVIRYPGGIYAEHYRWKDGIGPQHARGNFPISLWDDVDTNSLGTDEFIELCRQVGAEPMLVVNIGRHDPTGAPREAYLREALDWMEYCNGPADSRWGAVRAANGHPEPYNVRLWEIDNETWNMGVENYAPIVEMFSTAMRAAWPDIEIAACGSSGYGGSAMAWNSYLIENVAEHFDQLSIHHYEGPTNYDRGPRDYEAFFAATGERIAASANPQMKIFISEWNAQSTDWRTGLYAGGILNAFERQPSVAMAAPALFLRHVSAMDWDNAFVNFDQNTWYPAPNYVVMQLYRQHFQPQRLVLDGAQGPLNALATSSEDGRTVVLKVVNPTDTPRPLELTVPGARGAEAWQVAPDFLGARNTLAAPDAVRAERAEVLRAGDTLSIELPRLSVVVVRVTR